MVSLRFYPFNPMRLDPNAPTIQIIPYPVEDQTQGLPRFDTSAALRSALTPAPIESSRSDQSKPAGVELPLSLYDPRVAAGNRGGDAGSQHGNDPDSDLGDDMARGRSRTSVRSGMTTDTRLALLEDDMDSVHHVLQDANKLLNRLFIVGVGGIITFATSIVLLAINISVD